MLAVAWPVRSESFLRRGHSRPADSAAALPGPAPRREPSLSALASAWPCESRRQAVQTPGRRPTQAPAAAVVRRSLPLACLSAVLADRERGKYGGRGGNGMYRRRHGLLALLAVAIAVFVSPAGALADGKLERPRTVSDLGTVNGIAYRSYSGFFVGKTSTGNYRVPYELTGPVQPALGNGTVLVEVPHFAAGTAVRDLALGRHFVFGGRFSYGAVGWSTATSAGEVTNRILDPSARGVFIHGGAALPGEDGQTDDEIVVDFARALGRDPVAGHLLGPVDRRYLAGWSDSSETVKRIIGSGLADGLFELALPITTDQPFDPQDALAAGRYHGKVITLDSEFEWFYARAAEDRGGSPGIYRSYFVPGSPHVPDPLCPLFSNETTPASWTPELRARFVQGDAWVKTGAPPPRSTRLATTSSDDIDRDE